MTGVTFIARARIQTEGGTVIGTGDTLQVRGANVVEIRLVATSSFWPPELQRLHLETVGAHDNASWGRDSDYEVLKETHIRDHQSLYARCDLTLPSDPGLDPLPTDQRLARLNEARVYQGLEALLFHYGRYLLMASSRPGGNPANLQGLWNPHIEAPWGADYHLNINLQMNYWPACVTNLSETERPLFQWMKRLSENGVVTAREQYGMRGWMSHHACDIEAHTGMTARTAHWGSWIHGGGWLCQHPWTHYVFTEDKAFLEQEAYPLLAGQARFYLDWLTKESGTWISSFETSPENSFIAPDGRPASVCAKSAMGQQIIHEVLQNTLLAAAVLGIDDELTREIAKILPDLDTGLHIGPDGRILEWDRPYGEPEPGHRHLSHLYAFHPGNSITREKTPDLLEAVKKTIAHRTQHGSVGTGWSRSWAISMYARLGDGEAAHHHLHTMLRTQTLNNGFNSILGREKPLFQIEANLGATAGIAEVLLQSHGGFLHLLPALPPEWPEGSVRGLRARGGFTVDIAWKEGRLASYRIASATPRTVAVRVHGKDISILSEARREDAVFE